MGAPARPSGPRACLVVAPDRAPAVTETLAKAGLAPACAASEREALEALGAEGDLAAVYVAGALGPTAVASLAAAAGQRGDAPLVVLGERGTVQEAVDAMQLGAADYVAPPYAAEDLVRRLAPAPRRRAGRPAPLPAGLPGFVGTSPAMRRLYDAIEKIARYKSNVLLLGESGTGKELIARALHERGPRRQHLFVPVNCATLGREILENELFGHERGAFTGANERKKGLFELADGGTFFLDEIAEMDVSTQAKLLRVLERNEFRRVGGTGKVKVDLSIIAATNRDLEAAIAAERFRADLYYRLKVVTLVVPPLRDRREDIPALVEAFVADFNRRTGGAVAGFAPSALDWLVERDWPGNVRELRNAVEGACVLAAGEVVTLDDLGHLRPAARLAGAPRAAAQRQGDAPRHPPPRAAARAGPRRPSSRSPWAARSRRPSAASSSPRSGTTARAPARPAPSGSACARSTRSWRRGAATRRVPKRHEGAARAAPQHVPARISARSRAGPLPALRVGVVRPARPPPSVLLLARPGGEGDELFADLLEREDLCLLRVANAAAANRALAEMPVALVIACPEMPVTAIDAVVARLRRARSETPVLAIRARRAQEPAGWSAKGVAVLRLPLLRGVLSRSVDVVLDLKRRK